MRVGSGEWDFGDFGAESFCATANGLEGWQRRNEFFAWCEKGRGTKAEDFAGATAEDELFGLYGVGFRHSSVQGTDGGVRVAIGKLQGGPHRGDDFLRGAVGIFVAAENDRATGFADAGRGDEFAEGEIGHGRQAGGCGYASGDVTNKTSSRYRHRSLYATFPLIAGTSVTGQEDARIDEHDWSSALFPRPLEGVL
jgi:hypothetical protein